MLVSLAGVAAIAGHGSWEVLAHLRLNRGDLWVLAALVIYGFYCVIAAQAAGGASVELPGRRDGHRIAHDAAVHAVGIRRRRPDPWAGCRRIWAIAYTAVLPSFVAYLFFNRGVELIGAGPAGQSMHLMPLFGSILAVLFLHEQFQAVSRRRDRDDRGRHPAGLVQIGAAASGGSKPQHNVIALVRPVA